MGQTCLSFPAFAQGPGVCMDSWLAAATGERETQSNATGNAPVVSPGPAALAEQQPALGDMWPLRGRI